MKHKWHWREKMALENKLTEAQIRDMVGAPTPEEEQTCVCGEDIDVCPEAYEHMTHGA